MWYFSHSPPVFIQGAQWLHVPNVGALSNIFQTLSAPACSLLFSPWVIQELRFLDLFFLSHSCDVWEEFLPSRGGLDGRKGTCTEAGAQLTCARGKMNWRYKQERLLVVLGPERECFALGGGAAKGDERRRRGRRKLCESGVGKSEWGEGGEWVSLSCRPTGERWMTRSRWRLGKTRKEGRRRCSLPPAAAGQDEVPRQGKNLAAGIQCLCVCASRTCTQAWVFPCDVFWQRSHPEVTPKRLKSFFCFTCVWVLVRAFVPPGGCGRNCAVFPLYSLLAPPWKSGRCGTGAARPGIEWRATPYKEDHSSGVGPAELSHAAWSQVPPLGCWLSPLLHLKTCYPSRSPLFSTRQLLQEALNQLLEASRRLADKESHCVRVKSPSLTCSSSCRVSSAVLTRKQLLPVPRLSCVLKVNIRWTALPVAVVVIKVLGQNSNSWLGEKQCVLCCLCNFAMQGVKSDRGLILAGERKEGEEWKVTSNS